MEVCGQFHGLCRFTPQLPTEEGGWVGPTVVLNVLKKSLGPVEIRTPDRPARRPASIVDSTRYWDKCRVDIGYSVSENFLINTYPNEIYTSCHAQFPMSHSWAICHLIKSDVNLLSGSCTTEDIATTTKSVLWCYDSEYRFVFWWKCVPTFRMKILPPSSVYKCLKMASVCSFHRLMTTCQTSVTNIVKRLTIRKTLWNLLRCHAEQIGNYLTFRDNQSIRSSRVNQSKKNLPLKMGAIGCP